MTSACSSFNGRPTTKGWECYSIGGLQWQENSGMAAGFAKLPSQGEKSHHTCLHLPRTEGANTAIIWGAEDQIFYGYGTLGDIVFKMANSKLAYVHLHESAEN